MAVNFLFTFAMGQAFLSMLCGMQWGIFLLFACFCVLMTAFVWIFLPGAPQPLTCQCNAVATSLPKAICPQRYLHCMCVAKPAIHFSVLLHDVLCLKGPLFGSLMPWFGP